MVITKNDVQHLKTPCFVLDEGELTKCMNDFQKALDTRFDDSIIGYSVKTNALPYCLKVANENGCHAEVVSFQEYELALKIGFDKSHIIYNGPLKSKETFLDAIQHGGIVNIETWREIDWLDDLPENQKHEIGIRLNINTTAISKEDAFGENDDSRFGFSYESGDFQKAVELIRAKRHVRLVGIHTHKEPKTRSVRFYQRVIAYVLPILTGLRMQLDYWDVGGGFFGPMPGKPTFDDYARCFRTALDGSPYANVRLVVEPGNALLSSAFSYVCSVIDVKQHDGKRFVTTDGTRNDVDPFFHKEDYFKRFVHADTPQLCHQPQVVGGLTCLEYDRLFTLPEGAETLNVGDRVIFDRVGAYTMALTPLFIHYLPTVYLKRSDGDYTIIRKEWGVDEFIGKSIY